MAGSAAVTRAMIAAYAPGLLGPEMAPAALARFDNGVIEYGAENHCQPEFPLVQEALEEALDLFNFGAMGLSTGKMSQHVGEGIMQCAAEAVSLLTDKPLPLIWPEV